MSEGAELLRQAAARVRELASQAPAGPWLLDHEEAEQQGVEADEPWFRGQYSDSEDWRVGARVLMDMGNGQAGWLDGCYVADRLNLGFAQWAALMGPQVAEPLAKLLDEAAHDSDIAGGGAPAEAFARALLDAEVDV